MMVIEISSGVLGGEISILVKVHFYDVANLLYCNGFVLFLSLLKA